MPRPFHARHQAAPPDRPCAAPCRVTPVCACVAVFTPHAVARRVPRAPLAVPLAHCRRFISRSVHVAALSRRVDGALATTVIGDLLGCSFWLDRRATTAAAPLVDPNVHVCTAVITVAAALTLLALISGLCLLISLPRTHLAIATMSDSSNAANRRDDAMDVDEQAGSLPFPGEMMDTGVWREQYLNM